MGKITFCENVLAQVRALIKSSYLSFILYSVWDPGFTLEVTKCKMYEKVCYGIGDEKPKGIMFTELQNFKGIVITLQYDFKNTNVIPKQYDYICINDIRLMSTFIGKL